MNSLFRDASYQSISFFRLNHGIVLLTHFRECGNLNSIGGNPIATCELKYHGHDEKDQ